MQNPRLQILVGSVRQRMNRAATVPEIDRLVAFAKDVFPNLRVALHPSFATGRGCSRRSFGLIQKAL